MTSATVVPSKIRFRYRFLIGGSILILMGCLVKLEGYGNAGYSPIPGIVNMLIYFFLRLRDEKRLGRMPGRK